MRKIADCWIIETDEGRQFTLRNGIGASSLLRHAHERARRASIATFSHIHSGTVRLQRFQNSLSVDHDTIDVAFEIDLDYFQRQDGDFATSSSEETSGTEKDQVHPKGVKTGEQTETTRRRRRKQKLTGGRVSKKSSRTRAPIKPSQRNAANARERSRMRVLSKAFTKLKTSLPWVPDDTKLSKLDTLRLGCLLHCPSAANTTE
ncbi:putative transcription factor 21-like [Apostichopus japonicus]|uniref:Putative transcription factor 21-like n=1 Tax=Stichopus japonicus TaxID=307972 RepID=A0A2G8KY09_STIJA|nr:putative transcription factor 21-like [Apostichopus japonicus]